MDTISGLIDQKREFGRYSHWGRELLLQHLQTPGKKKQACEKCSGVDCPNLDEYRAVTRVLGTYPAHHYRVYHCPQPAGQSVWELSQGLRLLVHMMRRLKGITLCACVYVCVGGGGVGWRVVQHMQILNYHFNHCSSYWLFVS